MAENYSSYLDPFPPARAPLSQEPPLPQDSDEEFFADIARQTLQAHQTEPAAVEPGIGSRILGGIGDIVGAQKHGIDYLARRAAEGLGVETRPEETTGQLARRAVGLESSPEQGIPGALAGRALEFATDIATDPLTYETAALGKLVGAGTKAAQFIGPRVPEAAKAAEEAIALGSKLSPLHTAVGAGFTGMMGLGALQEGQQAAHTLSTEGLTPRGAEEILGTGLSGLGALAGASHLAATHRPMKPVDPALARGLQRLEAKGEIPPGAGAEVLAREQGVAPPTAPTAESVARIPQTPPAEPTPPPERAPIPAVEAPPEPAEALQPPPQVNMAAPPAPEAPAAPETLRPQAAEIAPPPAPSGPRVVTVEVNGKPRQVELTPEQSQAWDDAAEKHAYRVEAIKAGRLGGSLKGAAMQYAAEKRQITQQLTDKETANKAALDAKIRKGDTVQSEGKQYEVLKNPAYGRVKVKDVAGNALNLNYAEVEKVAPKAVSPAPAPNPSATVPVEPIPSVAVLQREFAQAASGKLWEKVWMLLDDAGRPLKTLTPDEAGAAKAEGLPTTWVKNTWGKAKEAPGEPPELQEASRQPPLPPGALAGKEGLSEAIVGKGYSERPSDIRGEFAAQEKALGREGARGWLEEQYLSGYKSISPERLSRLKRASTRSILEQLEEDRSKSPSSVYEPGSPAAEVLGQNPSQARKDFVQERITKLLAQDTPSAQAVMAQEGPQRRASIVNWLRGAVRNAEIDEARTARRRGVLSFEEAGQAAANATESALQSGGEAAVRGLSKMPPEWTQQIKEFKRANDSYEKGSDGKLTAEGKATVEARVTDLMQNLIAGYYDHPQEAVRDLAELSNIATTYSSDYKGGSTPWFSLQEQLRKRIPGMEDFKGKGFEAFAQQAAGKIGFSVKDWVKARFTQDPDFVRAFGEKRAKGELQGAERNDAFKKWFGKSKVVDERGEPLTVYKGMEPTDWTKEPARKGFAPRGPERGPVLNVIDRQSEFPAFHGDEPGLKLAGFFGDKDTANRFADLSGGEGAVYPAHLSLQNPYVVDATGRASGDIQFGASGKAFRDAMRSGKYDGAIIKNTKDEGTVYVAMRPEQIKSATGNRGTFDPSNPDIRFSKRGEGLVGLLGQIEATPVEGHPDLSILNHTEARTPALDAATQSFAKEAAEPLRALYERLRSLTGAQGGTLGGFTSSTAHEGAFVGGKSYLNPSYHFSDAIETAKLYGLEGDAEAIKSIAATRAVATLEHEFLHDLGGHQTEQQFAEALRALQTASRADAEYGALEKALRDSISDETVAQFRETTPTFERLVEERYGNRGVGSGEGALQGLGEGRAAPGGGAELGGGEGLPEGSEGLGTRPGGNLGGSAERTLPGSEGELAAASRDASKDNREAVGGAGAEATSAGEEARPHSPKARGESPEAVRLVAARASGSVEEIKAAANDLIHARLLDVAKAAEGDAPETARQKALLRASIGSVSRGKFGEGPFKQAMHAAGAPTEAADALWEAIRGTAEGGSSAEFSDLFSKLMKPQGWSNWKTWLSVWKAGFLGAPSQVANAGGNAVFQGLRRVEGQMAVFLDALASNFDRPGMGLKKGERSRFISEWGAASRGRARAWLEAWPDLKEAIKQAASLKGQDLSQLEKHLGSYQEAALAMLKGPQNDKLYEFLMLPFKSMEAMDDLAKHQLKWEEFYQEAHREGKKAGLGKAALLEHEATMAEEMNQGLLAGEGPMFEKHARSIERAAEYRMKEDTFQATLDKKRGWISGGAAGLNKLANDLPPIELIVPFRKTAANVAIQALMRTPYGFRRVFKAYKRGDFKADPARLYDELAKPMLGTAIMGGIVPTLIGTGMITGQGPADPRQQALKRETGWQPYSFKFGDTYIPYNRVEPLASVLGMAADMGEAIMEGKKTTAQVKLKLALSSIGKNLLNKTFLAQLSGAMQAGADPIRFGPAFAKQLTASIVPNTLGVIPVGNLASAIDPAFRKTNVLTAPLAKIPGVSRFLPEQETALGTPRERTGGEGIIGGLQRLLLPSQVTSVRSDVGARVAGELDRLDFPVQPPPDHITIQGRRIDLSSEQRRKLQEAQLQAVNHMNRMIQDKTYQGMPDSPDDAALGQKTKEYMLKKLLERYREPVMNEIKARAQRRSLQPLSAQA